MEGLEVTVAVKAIKRGVRLPSVWGFPIYTAAVMPEAQGRHGSASEALQVEQGYMRWGWKPVWLEPISVPRKNGNGLTWLGEARHQGRKQTAQMLSFELWARFMSLDTSGLEMNWEDFIIVRGGECCRRVLEIGFSFFSSQLCGERFALGSISKFKVSSKVNLFFKTKMVFRIKWTCEFLLQEMFWSCECFSSQMFVLTMPPGGHRFL